MRWGALGVPAISHKAEHGLRSDPLAAINSFGDAREVRVVVTDPARTGDHDVRATERADVLANDVAFGRRENGRATLGKNIRPFVAPTVGAGGIPRISDAGEFGTEDRHRKLLDRLPSTELRQVIRQRGLLGKIFKLERDRFFIVLIGRIRVAHTYDADDQKQGDEYYLKGFFRGYFFKEIHKSSIYDITKISRKNRHRGGLSLIVFI